LILLIDVDVNDEDEHCGVLQRAQQGPKHRMVCHFIWSESLV